MGQIDDERIEAAKDLRVRAMAHATQSAQAGVSYVPSPERWAENIQAERARQREGAYTAEHDREHGVDHLLRWSQEYARLGKVTASAALVEAAREQLLSLVVELNRARDNGAVFTYGEIQRRLMGVYHHPTVSHAEWCHVVTGCAEPDHCTCEPKESA